jgi:hypothetical protein
LVQWLIYVEEATASSIDAFLGDHSKSVKIMENGQMYILCNGIRYNANGTAVK